MNTYIRKDYRGNWRAETRIDIEDNRVVTVSTYKISNGSLCTNVSVGTLNDGFISHRVFADYNKFVKQEWPKRVTEKVVSSQHDSVLSDIDSILSSITEFYSLETA